MCDNCWYPENIIKPWMTPAQKRLELRLFYLECDYNRVYKELSNWKKQQRDKIFRDYRNDLLIEIGPKLLETKYGALFA